MIQTRLHPRPIAVALTACLLLTACGGGGGGGASATSAGPTAQSYAMKGSAVDGPLAFATVTFTSGAPTGSTGATVIGTTTTDAVGNYSLTPALPSGSVPIFANVVDPNNAALQMSSYIGQSDTLAAAEPISSSSVPDLNITPVTTAALAVYGSYNGDSYAKLSSSAYGQIVMSYNSTVVTIASAIKAVGDKLCSPSSTISSTRTLATQIAKQVAAASSTTDALTTAIEALGSSCAKVVATLPQVVSSDPTYAPQLSHGSGTAGAKQLIPPGTYELQGVAMQNGLTANVSIANLLTAAQEAPADVVSDPKVTIDSTGKLTSSDGTVTGQLTGPLLSLTLVDPTTQVTYTLKGTVAALPAAGIKGSGFSLRTSGTFPSALDGASLLAKFDAVLVTPTATPLWDGSAAPSAANSALDVSCPSGEMPLRLDLWGNSPSTFGACVSTTPTSWTFHPALSATFASLLQIAASYGLSFPQFSLGTWNALPNTPFILSLGSVGLNLGLGQFLGMYSGSGYLVMGGQSLLLSGTATLGSSNLSSAHTTTNVSIAMHNLALDTPVLVVNNVSLPTPGLTSGLAVFAP